MNCQQIVNVLKNKLIFIAKRCGGATPKWREGKTTLFACVVSSILTPFHPSSTRIRPSSAIRPLSSTTV